MIDLIASTVDGGLDSAVMREAKREAFLAILDEEREVGRCKAPLIDALRGEVEDRLTPDQTSQ